MLYVPLTQVSVTHCKIFAEPSSGKPTNNTWTSTAKSTANADSNKREENVKSKVVFDEMGDGKEKQDVPEKENKISTSKSGMAGDTHDSSQVQYTACFAMAVVATSVINAVAVVTTAIQ